MELESLIFDYNKRKQMRDHPVFVQIKDIWQRGAYSASEKTGCLNYLMKQIHENKTIDNEDAIVKQMEWIQFYFDSGKKRKTEEETFQNKQYYGRTLEELYEIALELKRDVNNVGYNINEQAALNIVYIKVIDDTYNEYMRCFNVIFKLKNVYPEFTFSLAKPLEATEYGVDVIVKAGNKMISSLRILPILAIKRKDEEENKYKQQHEIFKMIYNIDTLFVYSSIEGNISGSLPSF